jgi:uncharacterized membrane protein YjfL (UPF0719 family)
MKMIGRKLILAGAALAAQGAAWAAENVAAIPAVPPVAHQPLPLGQGVMMALVYALVGAVALLICFKAFDKAITKIDFEAEIAKGNVAAGIFAAAIVLGIALIVAAAIGA